eukprot:CAMPEP_0196138248 /NCGR_PEP_ID=MMETSP0910-20130528/5952_1 /TAXON_ID=49265 /ORGANISM="Thalassiosira rotula, Strain GSO102" /LENGTH=530 /DNA_ID=CAMNT_0041398827 /DNA_START=481 /DNA_END=2073 /DNA_ORIENTATION=+
MASTSRPGAMSLLDKYASINTSIEDARRRVATAQSNLERTNEKIHNLREERNNMLVETESAKMEKVRIETNLKEEKSEHRSKVAEKECAEREHRAAKSEYDGMRRRIDDERVEFLERCREFRASCKRMRVAASILVLDGGGNFDAKDASDEADIWRRLQEEDFLDVEEEEEDASDGTDVERSNKRKPRKADPEVDMAENDEKASRQALIEAECALHAERMKNSGATKKSNARTQRLNQQRSQLQRHRKEVEELEREIQKVKDDVVQENQLANAFEKECNKRKQIRNTNSNASHINFNRPPEKSRPGNSPYSNTYTNASDSNNFNPPPEEQRYAPYSNNFSNPPPEESRSGNNPYYTQNNNSYNPYSNNNQNNHRTPRPPKSSGQRQRPGGAVTNPYNKAGRTLSAPDPPRNSSNSNSKQYGHNDRVNNAPMYASDMIHGATPEFSNAQRNGQSQHHPHRGRNVRSQRQFGTTIGVSLDSEGMTDELQEFSKSFSSDATKKSGSAGGDLSDISSSSSDDEDLFSFSVFGKK